MKLFIPIVVIVLVLLSALSYVYVDYRRHKKPLESVDPNVNYSLFHHIAVVTIPIFRYRLSIRLSKINPNSPKGVHKF